MIHLIWALLMLFYFERVSAAESGFVEKSHQLADVSENKGLDYQRDSRNKSFKTGHSTSSPYSVQADEYLLCIENAAGVHIEMIRCIDAEIDRNNTRINIELDASKKDPLTATLSSALKNSEKSWDAYVNAKCDFYLGLGGQRAELLNRSCILGEILFRVSFVSGLLVEARN